MLIKLETYNLLYFGITADLVFIVNFPDASESLKKVCETNKQTNFWKKLIILELYQNQNSDKVWFIIYADLECFIEKVDSCKNNAKNSTKIKVAKHTRLKIKGAKHIIILTLLAPGWVGVEGGGVQCTKGVYFCRELLNGKWF